MEESIQISKINDFIFCPHSIYLHGIYESFHESVYHDAPQKQGKLVHDSIEKSHYSSSSRYLQGLSLFCNKYKLVGKIDIYDTLKKMLIERKFKLHTVFPGHRYQLYAQAFAMQEMGYEVEALAIHSLSDNKRYSIPLPDEIETKLFEQTIEAMRSYNPLNSIHEINPKKCVRCIYHQLCHKALC